MPEWLIGAVLKTVVRASVPRVRIPIPPPFKVTLWWLFVLGFEPAFAYANTFTFFQDIWSEVFSVIARAKARNNPAFVDFLWPEMYWAKMSEMSSLGNQNVRIFALFVQKLHSKVGLTLVNQKQIGRLKSTLLASKKSFLFYLLDKGVQPCRQKVAPAYPKNSFKVVSFGSTPSPYIIIVSFSSITPIFFLSLKLSFMSI